MNYYEELAVDSTASAEQIRRAYRRLAQLLHPDQYQDEALRRICERQLARLNGIAEILEDPQRRLEYDLSLEDRPPAIARGRQWIVERLSTLTGAQWVWVGAAVAGVALIAWLFWWAAGSSGETPYRTPAHTEETPAPAAAVTPKPARARAATAKAEAPPQRPKAVAAAQDESAPPAPALAKIEERNEAPAVHRAAATPLPPRPAPIAPAAATPEPAQRRERSYFAGNWFYTRDVSRREPGLYPPEMIELAITDDGGILRGRYRSRYRVTDRPISPDVNFEFQGPAPKEESIEMPWTAEGGAEGRVRLKAVTRVSMEVNWWVTRLGGLDLTSGTAVLIRGTEQ